MMSKCGVDLSVCLNIDENQVLQKDLDYLKAF